MEGVLLPAQGLGCIFDLGGSEDHGKVKWRSTGF